MPSSTHFFSPLTVSVQRQSNWPPQLLFGHLLLLMAGSPRHPQSLRAMVGPVSSMMLCAPAARGNRASSPILPRTAAPASFSARRREMAPLASPWLSSSKSCPSEVSPRAISSIVWP